MKNIYEFGLLSFASLFTMVNPLGIVPVYVSMTAGLSPEQKRATARKATIIAFLILMAFAMTGQFIFEFFGITVHSLRIVGGVILFYIGFEMLQARISRTKQSEQEPVEYVTDIAITPLAIPIICGPGAIAAIIVLMEEATTIGEQAMVLFIALIVILITFVTLRSGELIMRTLGESGNNVLMRIMGLIVMVIAVEFFFGGLTPILRDIFQIEPPAP